MLSVLLSLAMSTAAADPWCKPNAQACAYGGQGFIKMFVLPCASKEYNIKEPYIEAPEPELTWLRRLSYCRCVVVKSAEYNVTLEEFAKAVEDDHNNETIRPEAYKKAKLWCAVYVIRTEIK